MTGQRSIRTSILAITTVALGVGFAAVAPANAATISIQVDTNRACQYAYGPGTYGSSIYWYSPYAIYCYGLSFPPGISWQGPLTAGRINGYCAWKYNGRAVVKGHAWDWPPFRWYCVVSN
jgi:hypothetical protein